MNTNIINNKKETTNDNNNNTFKYSLRTLILILINN